MGVDQTETAAMFDRRQVIAGGLAAAAAAGVIATATKTNLLDFLPFVGDTAPFDRTSILGHIGETFRVTTGPFAGAVIQLVEVVDLPTQVIDAANDQFIAHFVPKSGPLLETGTYQFASASFGRLPLFLGQRLTDEREPFGYQALVNRFVPHDFNGMED